MIGLVSTPNKGASTDSRQRIGNASLGPGLLVLLVSRPPGLDQISSVVMLMQAVIVSVVVKRDAVEFEERIRNVASRR